MGKRVIPWRVKVVIMARLSGDGVINGAGNGGGDDVLTLHDQ